jgi:hypothetical protein
MITTFKQVHEPTVITVSTSQLFIGQCHSCYTICYTISLIIEEAYRRNKIDVNKYINTEGNGFDLSQYIHVDPYRCA